MFNICVSGIVIAPTCSVNFLQCGSWGFHLTHRCQFPFGRWLFYLLADPGGTPPLRPATSLCRHMDLQLSFQKLQFTKSDASLSRHKDEYLKIMLIHFTSSLILTKTCISTLAACAKFNWERYRSMCASSTVVKRESCGLGMWLVRSNMYLWYKIRERFQRLSITKWLTSH